MPRKNPIIDAYNQGKRDGTLEVRNQVLNYLEKEYMEEGVVRGTPIAEEILKMARELSLLMKV